MSPRRRTHTRGEVVTIIVVLTILLGLLVAAVGKVYETSQRRAEVHQPKAAPPVVVNPKPVRAARL